MNSRTTPIPTPSRPSTPLPIRYANRMTACFGRIPHDLVAVLARVSVAMTFWQSGQTKIEGLVVDPLRGAFELGIPRLSDNALELFRSEYALPLLALLAGLASRLSALALLVMTLVIQVFVYPDAFPTHGLWAVALLYLMARGPGTISLDALLARVGTQGR